MSHCCEPGVYRDVYRETIRKANRAHQCDACKLPIRPGDYYAAVWSISEGEAEAIKRCGACQTMHLHLRKLCEDSDFNMWPDDRLYCGRDYEEEWGVEPPDEIAALPLLSDDERGALLKPAQVTP